MRTQLPTHTDVNTMPIHSNATRRAFRRLLAAGALAVTAAACSTEQILEVEDIDVVRPESVQDSVALPTVLAGALGNYGVAYNGSLDINQIALSGMITTTARL